MSNLYFYCEGITEEGFVNQILYDYFYKYGIYSFPIVCETKRTAQKKYRGGVVSYAKIKRELQKLCKSHPNEKVTTMLDYYRLPEDAPSIDCDEADIYDKITMVESAITNDIGQPNLIVNLMLHEYESLLYTDPQSFNIIADTEAVNELQEIRNEFATPEHINNSVETAPSKRILKIIPEYSKPRHGVMLAKKIGISKMLDECKHFEAWISRLRAES